MAVIAGLQSYGQDILDNDTYRVSAYPTTHLQAKEMKKGNPSDQKIDTDNQPQVTGMPKPQVPLPQ
jgi:hypothetical protein